MATYPFRRAVPALVAVLVALGATGVTAGPAGSVDRAGATVPATESATQPVPVADSRLIVGLEPAASPHEAAEIAEDAGVTGAAVVDDHTIVVNAAPGRAGASQAEELREDDRVRYVEPNFRVSSTFTPNDPSFPSLGALRNTQPGGIRAQSAWNTTLGSRDIVVGVLDSGIDETHPDLMANLWSNRLGIGGCAYGTHGYNAFTRQCTSTDRYGHGTHVAGIIGAVGDNGIGISGVAPRVSLMSLAMLDQRGNGSIAGAVAAIDWALDAKRAGINLRVLSASWGGAGYSQALTDAIQRAGDAGVLLVAAAGNSGTNLDQHPVYPCAGNLANVVCVAATQGSDQLTAFSDFGTGQVDLAAPGERIISTVPRGVIPECGQTTYCALDGTSMAAPMVTGAAVLATAANPALTVAALRTLLLQAVDPVPSLAGKVATGGRLDVCKAVPGCGGRPGAAPSPPTGFHVEVVHGKATLRWSPPSSNGNGSAIAGYTVLGPGTNQQVGAGVRSFVVPGLTDNITTLVAVKARNSTGESLPAFRTGRSFSGGFIVHQSGRLARLIAAGRPKPSETSPTDLAPGQSQARGVAVLPDGTGGYVLDGYGGLHPFGIGGHPAAAPATGARYTKTSDWARGVALMPDGTSGYVLDGAGTLYGFSIGNNLRPPPTNGGPRFTGDVARGVTINAAGTGGYIVDRSGTISRFGIRGAPLPPVATGGMVWPGLDMVRGIALARGSGGGFVLDRYGAVYPFGTLGQTPARPVSGPAWPGVDRARGIGL